MFQISLTKEPVSQRIYGTGSKAIVFADIIGALSILAACLLVAWLVRFLLRKLEKRASGATTTVLDDLLLRALGTPAVLAIVLTGLYLGLAYLPLDPSSEYWTRRGLFLALLATGTGGSHALRSGRIRKAGCAHSMTPEEGGPPLNLVPTLSKQRRSPRPVETSSSIK